MRIERQVELRFSLDAVCAETHTNLSAVRTDGDTLWIAGDETATVERMARHGDGYGDQRSFVLDALIDLPGHAEEEADIEGLARAGGYLWAVGSHSLVRKKVKPAHVDEKAIRRLATIKHERNRYVIARLAMDASGDLVRDGSALFGGPGSPTLADVLADDEHLAPFLAIPAKDNGLDVEGLAIQGDRLYLGLRGPVLRGWAVVLEVWPVDGEPGRLTLAERAGRLYRKHFLDLGGLGVRDMCRDGGDLLVLAGPSMDLDGPVRVYRWHDAADAASPEVVRGQEITAVLDLPYGDREDHAEGIALLDTPDGPRLLVVYDSPAPARLPRDGVVLADVVAL